MKKIAVLCAILCAIWAGSAGAQTTAMCPPVAPTFGITASQRPVIPGMSSLSCDYGFTVGTSSIVVQAPASRHFFKLQNTSSSTSCVIGVCLGNLELNQACTMATAGTQLGTLQAFYLGVAMYGGINPLFNSLFFNGSVEVIANQGGCSASITVD